MEPEIKQVNMSLGFPNHPAALLVGKFQRFSDVSHCENEANVLLYMGVWIWLAGQYRDTDMQ